MALSEPGFSEPSWSLREPSDRKKLSNMTESIAKIIWNIKRLAAKNARLDQARLLKEARLFVVTEWTRALPHQWFD